MVPAVKPEVVDPTSPSEKRTLLDARFRVGVVVVLSIVTEGLAGDISVARRLVRRRASGTAVLVD